LHYRDALGFEIGWLEPTKALKAASRDRAAIFFRKREAPFEPEIRRELKRSMRLTRNCGFAARTL